MNLGKAQVNYLRVNIRNLYLCGLIDGLVSQRAEQSRAHIQKFIEAGFARVNGKTGKAKLPLGQVT